MPAASSLLPASGIVIDAANRELRLAVCGACGFVFNAAYDPAHSQQAVSIVDNAPHRHRATSPAVISFGS